MSLLEWQLLGAILFLVLLLRAAEGGFRKYRLRQRFRRGAEAEKEAGLWLERQGYRILEIQPQRCVDFRVGNQWQSSMVRADYLVQRWLKRYVVEVKSGNQAPDPTSRSTRRQLREYGAVFPYPVLLFDAEAKRLTLVDFRKPKATLWWSRLLRLGLGWLFWLVVDLYFFR